jgi:manganese transport protein
MLCAAAALFHRSGGPSGDDLTAVHAGLGSLVGGGAALAFGVALMTSGLSSASVGTYAGQVIMAGFMSWRIPLLVRRALTLLPSFLIVVLAVDTGRVLLYSQVALSLGIPFALWPLLLISRDRRLLGGMANRRLTTVLTTAAVVVITGLNGVFVVTAAHQAF